MPEALVRVMLRVFVGRAVVWAQRVRKGHGTSRGGLPMVSPFACSCLAVAGAGAHTTDPTFFSTACVRMWSWIGVRLTCKGAFLDYTKFFCIERGARSPVAHTSFYEEVLFW